MTHLPNEVALKMDGAQASRRCPAVGGGDWCGGWCEMETSHFTPTPRSPPQVGGRGGGGEGWGLCSPGTAASADLGGSSKYSKENFED